MAGFIGLATGLGRIGAGLGRARREAADANQRDAERQAAIEREVQQRAFANWLQRQQLERMAEQDKTMRLRYEAQDTRQREQDILRALESGYQDATPDVVNAGVNAATMALGMGRGGMNTGPAPFKATVGGVDIQADNAGGPRFATVGGKLMRMDPQQAANAAARLRAEKEQLGIADDNRRLQQTLQAIGARSAVDAQQQRAPAVVTQGERQGTALYQFAEPAAQRVLKRYANGFEASGTDKFAEAGKAMGPDMLFNWMQSDEGQQMYDDLTSVVLATQYGLSGKAVTEAEARRLARNLMPAVGDKPGRRAQKILEVNNRMRILRTMAGRGVDPNAPTTLPETMDDLRAKRPRDIP